MHQLYTQQTKQTMKPLRVGTLHAYRSSQIMLRGIAGLVLGFYPNPFQRLLRRALLQDGC